MDVSLALPSSSTDNITNATSNHNDDLPNNELSGTSEHIDRINDTASGENNWEISETTITTNCVTQSNSQSLIQNGHLSCRPSTGSDSQGRTQRPRTYYGPYPYEARTGSVLCPNRTAITIQELQEPEPKQNKTFVFFQLFRIKACDSAST